MALITVVFGTSTQETVGETITYNLSSQQELCSSYELSHLNSLQYLIMIDICGDTITHVERERQVCEELTNTQNKVEPVLCKTLLISQISDCSHGSILSTFYTTANLENTTEGCSFPGMP